MITFALVNLAFSGHDDVDCMAKLINCPPHRAQSCRGKYSPDEDRMSLMTAEQWRMISQGDLTRVCDD